MPKKLPFQPPKRKEDVGTSLWSITGKTTSKKKKRSKDNVPDKRLAQKVRTPGAGPPSPRPGTSKSMFDEENRTRRRWDEENTTRSGRISDIELDEEEYSERRYEPKGNGKEKKKEKKSKKRRMSASQSADDHERSRPNANSSCLNNSRDNAEEGRNSEAQDSTRKGHAAKDNFYREKGALLKRRKDARYSSNDSTVTMVNNEDNNEEVSFTTHAEVNRIIRTMKTQHKSAGKQAEEYSRIQLESYNLLKKMDLFHNLIRTGYHEEKVVVGKWLPMNSFVDMDALFKNDSGRPRRLAAVSMYLEANVDYSDEAAHTRTLSKLLFNKNFRSVLFWSVEDKAKAGDLTKNREAKNKKRREQRQEKKEEHMTEQERDALAADRATSFQIPQYVRAYILSHRMEYMEQFPDACKDWHIVSWTSKFKRHFINARMELRQKHQAVEEAGESYDWSGEEDKYGSLDQDLKYQATASESADADDYKPAVPRSATAGKEKQQPEIEQEKTSKDIGTGSRNDINGERDCQQNRERGPATALPEEVMEERTTVNPSEVSNSQQSLIGTSQSPQKGEREKRWNRPTVISDSESDSEEEFSQSILRRRRQKWLPSSQSSQESYRPPSQRTRKVVRKHSIGRYVS